MDIILAHELSYETRVSTTRRLWVQEKRHVSIKGDT